MSSQRTPGELQADSKTLWYEFSQFLAVAALLRDKTYSNIHVQNALVESFALHCRAICCFFFPHCKGFKGYDLRLMSSVNDVSGILIEGKNLIIVAAVDNVLHFRIFDGDGKVVVDTDEKRLTAQAWQIEELRKQLESLWPPHELTKSDKDRVITAVEPIFGHTRFPSLRKDDLGAEHYDKDWKDRYPKAPSILSAAKGSCDKLVAHMTAERRDLNFVPGKEHRWQVDLIEDELREVLTTFLDTFLRHAPNDRFDPKALAELQKMKQPRTARGQIPPANATGATGPGPPFAREQIPPANATGATDPGPPLGFGFWE